MASQKKALVSACLLGLNCRYDGRHKRCDELIEKLKREGYEIIPICPEVEGGLPVPREPATREGNKVITNFTRRDVTEFFLLGALKALQKAKTSGVKEAYLKSKSPSCGEEGITAEVLKKEGIKLRWY